MFSLTPCSDSLFVVGGSIFGSFLASIQRYIIPAATWTDLPVQLEIGVMNPGTVNIGNDQVLIFGGST
jgi:hypothetical protein